MPGAILNAEQAAPAPEADVASASEPPIDPTPAREYTVFRQHVALDIDFRKKSVKGRADIYVTTKESDVSDIFIDARQCEVDVKNITVSGCAAEASYSDPYELAETPKGYAWSAKQWAIRKARMRPLAAKRRVELSATDHERRFSCTPVDGSLRISIPPAEKIVTVWEEAATILGNETWDKAIWDNKGTLLHKISIPFVLKDIRDGLHFVGVDDADLRYPHLYTRHSIEPGTASSIFPCIDDPGCRSDWKLSITFPRTMGDAFHQSLSTQQQPSVNGSRKRKLGEDAPRQHVHALSEEDKMLEMTVVCSGRLEDENVDQEDETRKTMTFACDSKAARHIGFAVGPFEHIDLWSGFRAEEDDEKLGSNATKIHGYCLPGRGAEVRNTCAPLVTAIDYFVLTFGRYPFDSYKVCFVDDMVSDTVPLAGFSLCSTRILYPQNIIDPEATVTRTLVHALSSQWFGVNIIPDRSADIWLVVGIAWFMTDLFVQHLFGINEYRFQMKARADKLVKVDINRPSLLTLGEYLHLGDFEVEFMNLKAPLVLFILDRRLSKSSGSGGITRIISKMVSKANVSGDPSDQIFVSDPFRKHCEKYGQTRLDSFWHQWVTSCGCPRFEVFQRFNKKRLCVEMTIKQTQDNPETRKGLLDKEDFWRDVMEENHSVWAGELLPCFTGPMTIRIHEADGTPYEHIVEIREDSAKAIKIEIPYNTKYKRLKRNRRQRERQAAGNASRLGDDNQEESLLYCLGDVLQTSEDIEEWGFVDWDEKAESNMDQESYEWIRMDADFEWICSMSFNLQPYMYVSQLQQDRDVVAQQDSMLFLGKHSDKAHPLISTILTRTLVDERYYHGIRSMAAQLLPRHGADSSLNRPGLKHLKKTFELFFCNKDSEQPRPNDFAKKDKYIVRSTLPDAIARVRDQDGKCPKEARRFILKQLQQNDNSMNPYSDDFYICKLMSALATSLIPDGKAKKRMSMSLSFDDADEDVDEDTEMPDAELEEFKQLALEEIERYRRRDEYSPSYQNCFTVAALDALCRLMKADVIPLDPLTFVQYLQDSTIDAVRIKGFESLVELGQMKRPLFLRFFLSVIGGDPSPFVRDRLFKVFCRGLASIAIGENVEADDKPPLHDSDLIVEQPGQAIENKQNQQARKEDLLAALRALKNVTKDDETLQEVVWDALDSPALSVSEKKNLLELCSILFEQEDKLIVTRKYPTYWTASIVEKTPRRLLVNFKRSFRTKPRNVFQTPSLPPRPEPKRTITLNVNRTPSISLPKVVSPAVEKAPVQFPVKPASAVKPAITVAPRPVPNPKSPQPASPQPPQEVRRDSISVQAPRPSIENPAAGSAPERKTLPQGNVPTKTTLSLKTAFSKASTPRSSTPQTSTPKVSMPKVPTPKAHTPKDPAPKFPAPKESAFRDATPKDSVPKDSAPRDSAFKATASNGPLSKIPTAKDSVSKFTAPKVSAPKLTAPKVTTPKLNTSKFTAPKASTPFKTNGSSALGLTAAPPQVAKSLKRQSTEPASAEPPRPTKIVKLNTKGIPASAFQKRSKIVKVKFNSWDRLKLRSKPNQRTATPEAGSISVRASQQKGSLPAVEKSSSLHRPSPGVSQSRHSTPTAAASNSYASPPLSASQLSSVSAQPRNGTNGGAPKIRKPLPTGERPSGERLAGERAPVERAPGERSSGERPSGDRPSGDRPSGDRSSGERRPLPSGERKALPSGDRKPLVSDRKILPTASRTALPSASPHVSSTQTPAAPPKPKIKLKVSKPSSQQ